MKEISKRYAKALFELSLEKGTVDAVMSELHHLNKIWQEAPDISDFFCSPVVTPENKEKVIEVSLQGQKFNPLVVQLMSLLAKKNRMNCFSYIVRSFEEQSDVSHGLARGIISSARNLESQERKKIEESISKWTGKNIIATYQVNPDVIGSVVAKVGSFIFDDTIESHLEKMKDELKRSVH